MGPAFGTYRTECSSQCVAVKWAIKYQYTPESVSRWGREEIGERAASSVLVRTGG